MARENIAKFEELLRSSDEAQAKLRAVADAYEGDKADEQAVFDATIGKVAAEVGLPFSLEEIKAHALEGVELNDGELDAVAGGISTCYGPGGGSDADAELCAMGFVMETGDGACWYVGVGLVNFT